LAAGYCKPAWWWKTAGLLGYETLGSAGAGVSALDLLAPMIVGGIGMGMVFVPLFDIVLAGIEGEDADRQVDAEDHPSAAADDVRRNQPVPLPRRSPAGTRPGGLPRANHGRKPAEVDV